MKKLHELTMPELEEELESKTKLLEKEGNDFVVKKSQFENLAELHKVILSKLKTSFEGSDAAKETSAMASPDYETYKQGLGAAREQYYQAQVKYDLVKLKIDVLRTIISNRREELQRFKA